ncbi:MAG: sensor histidine kinase [Lachnospiraceae bacterium]|nr:sensor histidine kinase [Lachnospiraceae bacterium]MDY5742695.1 sensor histidine kinase [Lachnospiraceae bacterium]
MEGETIKKVPTLKRQLTILMMLASACSLLTAGAAVFYVFFSVFMQKTRADMEYVLQNTGQQYQVHMQFIEDSVISIRHNPILDDFFHKEEYDRGLEEDQLSYSMELFSDRNMVQSKRPFVTGIYLFTGRGDCLYRLYYATTLAAGQQAQERYSRMQQRFRDSGRQYEWIAEEDDLNICFRIYDHQMREKGIGIVQISQAAVAEIFSPVKEYQDSGWAVLTAAGQILVGEGSEELLKSYQQTETVWSGSQKLGTNKVIGHGANCGFGLRSVLTASESNVFAILQPTMWILAFGLILVLVITFIVAYAVSHRFTKQVTGIIDRIRAFGKRDLNARMDGASVQEFQDIGTVFNEMADRMQYLITEVYEKQLLATQSQVKYLQSQIDPHFQFNILAMLSLKAKLAGNEELYQGLRAFSKLMQGKIFREQELHIPVREELEIVRFYLYLQKSRYQEKLSYDIVVEDESLADCLIPRLLIEPLVENAVSHGLEPKREQGKISLRLFRVTAADGRQMLHICVEDDGVGISQEKMREAHQEQDESDGRIEHTHTGLQNTRRMLEILYGTAHRMEIWSEEGRGTRVEIVIPAEMEGNRCGK